MADISDNLSSTYPMANTTLPPDDHYGHNVAPEDMKRFETALHLAVTIVFSLIIVLGVVGNLLVILVISINKHMKSSTNFLILNLAVADLSFILLCVIFTLFRLTGRWVFGDVWCKVMNFVNFTSTWVSVYTLVLLCIDRVLAVVFAIKLPGVRSTKNAVIAIIVVWLVSSMANVPALLFHGQLVYTVGGSEKATCLLLLTVSKNSKYTFQLCFFLFGFALPVFVISILYAILTVFLTRKAGPMAATATKTVSKAKRRVTVMVIVVVSAFVICWLPMQILMLLNTFELYRNDTEVAISLQIAANCLAYMNSCINPVLYTMTSATFRTAFSNLLCCRQQTAAKKLNPAAKNQKNNKKMIPNGNKSTSKRVKRQTETAKTEMEEMSLMTAYQKAT